MNTNFAKVIVVAVLGGVAKALFQAPAVHNHYHESPKSKSTDIELTQKDNI